MNYLSKQFRYLKQGAIITTVFAAIFSVFALVSFIILGFIYIEVFDAVLIALGSPLVYWSVTIVTSMPFFFLRLL